MLFSSIIFLFLFLPTVLIIYYILKKFRALQNIFLFISSIIFYAWGEPKFVFIMLLSIIINYIFGLLVDYFKNKNNKKIILSLTVIFNLSILFVFKYLAFTLENINSLFSLNIKIPSIILPIGISFFTFQAMSYVIDIYRRKGIAQKNPLNVGLYISYFPQLIAGPIVRYETVADEIKNRKETIEDFTDGVVRFIKGLSKKVILANQFAIIADAAFAPSEISILFAWLGIISYTLQIYFDFSGYSDMAIGLGKMFGFHFLENFNYPYVSKSITEFWRRWHISLGTWFRDYLYIPLGGSKVNKLRLIFNLFIVWLATGTWHGANWTFIVWGIMYFVLLTIEKLTDLSNKKFKNNFLFHFYTLFFVMIGWVFFRSDNINSALYYLGNMFGLNNNLIIDNLFLKFISHYGIFIILGLTLSTPFITLFKRWENNSVYKICKVIVMLFLFYISVTYIVKGSYNPFIYFNF